MARLPRCVLPEIDVFHVTGRGVDGIAISRDDALRFNVRHERRGHLFQERFHARAIRDDEHLANACDYVLDNAVRAGLCASRDDWPWLGGEFADLR
jgi:hypothetical protein